MKTYNIRVRAEYTGYYKIEAKSIDDAEAMAKQQLFDEMNDEVEKFCFLADNVKQLPLAIEKALNQNNKNTALIEEYQKKMLYKLDGSASIRARDEILKRINR